MSGHGRPAGFSMCIDLDLDLDLASRGSRAVRRWPAGPRNADGIFESILVAEPEARLLPLSPS